MKILLTILITLAALFGGGCILVVGGRFGSFVLFPFGIFIFNCWLLYGVWGAQNPWKPAFYVLGFIDLLLAVGSAFLLTLKGATELRSLLVLIALTIVFALKGVLTFVYARRN